MVCAVPCTILPPFQARKWIPVACGPRQTVRVNLRLDEILLGDYRKDGDDGLQGDR